MVWSRDRSEKLFIEKTGGSSASDSWENRTKHVAQGPNLQSKKTGPRLVIARKMTGTNAAQGTTHRELWWHTLTEGPHFENSGGQKGTNMMTKARTCEERLRRGSFIGPPAAATGKRVLK